jgi:hypothetical protein
LVVHEQQVNWSSYAPAFGHNVSRRQTRQAVLPRKFRSKKGALNFIRLSA